MTARRPGTSITAGLLVAAWLLGACEPPPPGGATPDAATTTTGPRADASSAGVPPPPDARAAVVERVVDGDTVVLEVDGERERARLLRIDTPELGRDGRPAECLAERASDALHGLLPPGTRVMLMTDVEARDQYGRLLVHLWTDDGDWVNGHMLVEGWANVVTFPPNTALDGEVLAAQRAARDARTGLWDPAAC